MNNYEWLIGRLDAFIRKYYANKVIRGTLVFLSCLLFYILTVSIGEYYLYLPVWSRIAIVSIFIALGSAALVAWIIIPLTKMGRLGSVISHEQAAEIIGKHFPEVSDRLLNILQLKRQNDHIASRELAEASINQKIKQISVVPISNAIDFSKNRKYLPLLLPLVLAGVFILVAAPSVFKESASRLLQPTKAFEKPAPFQFIIRNPDLLAVRNSDFVLTLETKGNALPAEVSVEAGSERLPMQPLDNHRFQYTFKNVTEAINFRFYAAGFYSTEHKLKVVQRPVLKEFKVQVNYPSYTGRKNEVRNSLGDMTVPAGTSVSWALVTDHTDAATIHFGSGSPVALNKNSDNYGYQFRFLNDTGYTITLENKAAGISDSYKYNIQVIPDQFPVLQVQQFRDTVSGKQTLITGTAGDDYGITRVSFNYEVTDKNKTVLKKSVPVKITGGTLSPFQQYFDIHGLNLKPGQKVSYYIEAWDNDGVHGSKASRSEVMAFFMYNENQLDSAINENSKQINSGISNSSQRTQQLQNDYKSMQSKMLQSNQMDWEQKESLEQMMKRQMDLKNNLENIKQRFDEQMQQTEQKSYSDDLKEKQKEMQKQLDNLLNKELEEQMKKLQELMEKLNKEDAMETMQRLEQENKLFKMDMERMQELMKKMEMQMRMEDMANKLDDLAKKERNLQKETEKAEQKDQQAGKDPQGEKKDDAKGDDKNGEKNGDNKEKKAGDDKKGEQNSGDKKDGEKKDGEKKDGSKNGEQKNGKEGNKEPKDNKQLSKDQQDIKKELDKMMKEDMKDLQKLGKEAKEDQKLENEEQQGKDAGQDMQESEEQLNQNNKSKAKKKQDQAAQNLEDMAKSMRDKAGGMDMDQIEIDIKATRQLLTNLMRLSFEQEDLLESVSKTSMSSQAYIVNQEKQNRLHNNSYMIRDSLFSLSKRSPKLPAIVNRETTELEYNMKKAVEALEARNQSGAVTFQQYVMTHTNNLALLLNELLANLMQAQGQAKAGKGGSCPKPGQVPGMGKKPKDGPGSQLSDIITEQKKLGESMQKMQQQGGKKPGSKQGPKPGQGQQGQGQNGGQQGDEGDPNGEDGNAEQIARLANQQAMLRKKIQELTSMLNSKGMGNSKELREIEQKMDKNETDLVNRRLTAELLMRQKEIETRMLEVEKAIRDQEQDDKRSSRSADEISRPVPPALQKYITDQQQLLELYKTVPPQLKPYYKQMVENYFHIIGNK